LCQRPARRPGDRNPVEPQNLNRRSRLPFPDHGGFPYQIEGRPYGHAGVGLLNKTEVRWMRIGALVEVKMREILKMCLP
jgi:hypothetical protein